MAELRLSINTQQAAQAAQSFQRILNDIKQATRELDSLSLGALGSTIGRVSTEAEKLQNVMRGVSSVLQSSFNVDASKIAALPSQLNAAATAAEGLSRGVKTVAEAFAQGWQLYPSQVARELQRQRDEVERIQTAAREREMQEEGKFALRFRGIQQERVRAVEERARAEEQIAQRSAEIQGQMYQRARAFDLSSGRQPIQIPQTAGPNAYAEGAFATGFTPTPLSNVPLNFPPRYGRSIGAPGFEQPSVNDSFRQYADTRGPIGGGGTTAMFADLQQKGGVEGMLADQQRSAGSMGQTATATRALGQALTETKVKKDALDKNLDTMSSQGGSLWRTSFSLRILTSALGALSLRALIEESKQLAETLVDTGMQLERATALFGLMSEGSMTASEGIALATKTANDFGLATLPAIAGLARMQASAYGTAAAGDAVNSAFTGLMAGLGAVSAEGAQVNSTMLAMSDSIGRAEISSRNLRQLSRDLPGLKERVAEAFGVKSVEEFMVILDKGNLTMSQWLNAFGKAFSGTVLEQAKANVNTLSGAVTGFHNAMLGLIQVMLNAGFKQDFIDGLKDLTETLTSPATLDAARQFSEMFGVIIKDALELAGAAVKFAAENFQTLVPILAGLATSGVLITIASGIGLIALALSGLGAAALPAVGVILALSLVVKGLVGDYVSQGQAMMNANKATDAHKKSTDELAKSQQELMKAKPTEQMIRQAKDDEIVREHTEQLIQTTTTYRTELDLLDAGIRKDSVSFIALGEAYKFINDQAAKGNIIDAVKRERILELTTAIASYNAQVTKRADNEKMLRDLKDQTDVTGALITLASGGANDSAIAMEQQFQDQFKRMKDRFEELIYMETDVARRQSLVDEFKQQAEALRGASLQAQLYANRLKAIQEINQGDRAMELEEQILDIWKSVNASVTTYTQRVTEATPSTIASFRPSSINPSSDAINATLYQLDRANIGAQRQQINGNVEMTISGNITIANARGGVSVQGGTAGSQTAIDRMGNYSNLFQAAGEANQLPPKLLQAMAIVESAGKGGATSPKGAMGVMQLMPGTASDMGVTDPYDPGQNIFGGAKYIRQMLSRAQGNLPEALAAYNAGPKAVPVGGGIPPIAETQKYVRDVIATFLQLGGQVLDVSKPQITGGLQPANVGTGTQIAAAGFQLGDPELWTKIKEFLGVGQPRQGFPQDIERLKKEQDSRPPEFIGPPELIGPPEEDPTVANARELAVIRTRTAPLIEAQERNDREMKAVEEKRRQQELYSLRTDEGALAPRALTGRPDYGEVTIGQRPRTRLEAARDEAGGLAVSQFNQNIQLMGITGGIGPTESGEPLPGLEDIEKQRRRVELQARVGVDQRTIKDQIQYNFSLADQNKELRQAQELLSTDAKYRDIDTQAANLQRKAIEESVDPEQRVHTQALIEANRQLQRSMVDLNGPFQQTIDSIGRFKERGESLFIGALSGMGDAIATFTTTGKFDIKGFADAFISDLIRMEFELLVIKPLLQSIQSGPGGGSWFDFVKQGLGIAASASGGSSATPTDWAGSGLATGGNVTLRGVEHFAGGGNVQSGTDTIPALLTPGEVILNKAQQRNVANASQGGNTYVFAPTVHAQDAESVRKTLPQIQAEFYRSTERITKRNNLR